MKRQFALIAIVTVLIVSCTGFFDMREYEEIIDRAPIDPVTGQRISNTIVIFNNTSNKFPVDVFSSNTRTVKVNHERISADGKSDNIYWVPTSYSKDKGFVFYLTFYLPIEGYDNILIPFIPQKWGRDFTISNIIFDTETTVPVHDLTKTIPLGEPLINDVCIIIENNYASAVQFNRGSGSGVSIALSPENLGSGTILINPNQNGLYIVPPAASSANYIVISNAFNNLPSFALAAGHVYIVTVDNAGTPILKESFPLTMSYFQD